MLSKPNTNNKSLIAALLSFVAIGGAGAYITKNNSANVKVNQVDRNNSGGAVDAIQTDSMSTYKDGTYSAEGNYNSPGGPEQIGVSLTITNNVITDATVTPEATRPGSIAFQDIFAQNYKTYVVGKSIKDLKLDHVAGSSLTPKGFNDALNKIRSQAKA